MEDMFGCTGSRIFHKLKRAEEYVILSKGVLLEYVGSPIPMRPMVRLDLWASPL
jgi:hypothetical protein